MSSVVWRRVAPAGALLLLAAHFFAHHHVFHTHLLEQHVPRATLDNHAKVASAERGERPALSLGCTRRPLAESHVACRWETRGVSIGVTRAAATHGQLSGWRDQVLLRVSAGMPGWLVRSRGCAL